MGEHGGELPKGKYLLNRGPLLAKIKIHYKPLQYLPSKTHKLMPVLVSDSFFNAGRELFFSGGELHF